MQIVRNPPLPTIIFQQEAPEITTEGFTPFHPNTGNTAAKYEAIDRAHDTLMSGGHNRVVMYKGKVELPNFPRCSPLPSILKP